jgi:hypothetical protein
MVSEAQIAGSDYRPGYRNEEDTSTLIGRMR